MLCSRTFSYDWGHDPIHLKYIVTPSAKWWTIVYFIPFVNIIGIWILAYSALACPLIGQEYKGCHLAHGCHN
jgi:hypothetical protein